MSRIQSTFAECGFLFDISRCKVPTMETLLGLERADRYLRGVPRDDLKPAYEQLTEEYKATWLLCARSSGLSESVGYIPVKS